MIKTKKPKHTFRVLIPRGKKVLELFCNYLFFMHLHIFNFQSITHRETTFFMLNLPLTSLQEFFLIFFLIINFNIN